MESTDNQFWEKYRFHLSLLGIGVLVYFNSLFGAFVWDDIAQIQQNNLIHSLSNLPHLFLGSTYAPQSGDGGAGTYYRPLMSLVFSLIYPISGAAPFLFHLVQLTIHIVNAILVFLLFKKIVKDQFAFVLAIIFLVHPLNVEAVSYISALGEPLYVLFGLLALLRFQSKNTTKQAILVSILLLCSLLAKETGVVFLVIIFAYYLLFARKQWRLLTVLGMTVVPLITYLFMRLAVAKVFVERIPDVPMMTAPLVDRIFTMPAIFWFYIKTFFFPNELFILQLWSIPRPDERFYLPLVLLLLVLLGLLILAVWVWKTNKHNLSAFIFFTVWFLVGIGVHMQLIPLDFTVADRYFYFAMIGLLGIIGVSFYNIRGVSPQLKYVGMTCIILIIVVLSVRTIVRNTNWENGLSLYSNDLQYQQNDRIQNALAIELTNAGRNTEANQHFKTLLARNPREPALYVNLASGYEMEGKFQQADEVYRKGLAVDDSGAVYVNLARMLLQREGKFSQARDVSEKGIEKFPQNGSLWVIKALANYKLGDKQNALKAAEKAKEILPNPAMEQFYNSIVNDTPL